MVGFTEGGEHMDMCASTCCATPRDEECVHEWERHVLDCFNAEYQCVFCGAVNDPWVEGR